jgi:hypothetical protein
VRLSAESPPPVAHDHEELRWLAPEEFSHFTWAAPDIPLLDCVRAALCG